MKISYFIIICKIDYKTNYYQSINKQIKDEIFEKENNIMFMKSFLFKMSVFIMDQFYFQQSIYIYICICNFKFTDCVFKLLLLLLSIP